MSTSTNESAPSQNKICYWREYHAISQRQISRTIGISNAEISAIERGRVLPNVTTAIRIAKVLGMAVTDL